MRPTDNMKQSPITASLEHNLETDVVKALACSLVNFSDYYVRHIFSSFGYTILTADKALKILLSQNVIKEVDTGGFSYRTYYYVSPDIVVKILSKMSLEEAMQFRKKANKERAFVRHSDQDMLPYVAEFLELLCKYLHDGPEGLNCGEVSKAAIDNMDSQIARIILYLLAMPTTRSFSDTLSEQRIKEWRNELLNSAADLSYTPDDSFRHLFFDEHDIGYDAYDSVAYVILYELFVDGQVDRLIEKYNKGDSPDSPNSVLTEYLKGVKSLHEGSPAPILAATVRLIESGVADLLSIPQFAWFALEATVMADDKTVTRKMLSLVKNLGSWQGALLRATLQWIQKAKLTSKYYNLLTDSAYVPSTMLLFSYFIVYFDMGAVDSQASLWRARYFNAMMDSGFKYLKMNYAALIPEMKDLRRNLEEECGMRALFAERGEIAPWEKTLDMIARRLNASRKTTGTSPEASVRVTYLIDKKSFEVHPVLQKSSDGLTWTKGRNIALKSFKEGKTEGMTPQDLRVAGLVKDYNSGYWGGADYQLPNRAALHALAGNPNLFTDDALRLKIEITNVELQLSVTTDANGQYKLTPNISADSVGEDNLFIDVSNPLSIRVAKLTDEQLTILKMLGEVKHLPKEAAGKLSEVLGAMSSKMTVLSDLVAAPASNALKTAASPLIVVQLVPDGESINVALYVKPLVKAPPYLTPGIGTEYVNGTLDGKPVQAHRDLKTEAGNLKSVVAMLAYANDSMTGERSWQLSLDRTLELLAQVAAVPDKACVEWPEGAKMKVSRQAVMPSAFDVRVKNSSNWFEMEGSLRIDEHTVLTMVQLLQKLREGRGRFIRLEGDEYVALSQHLADTLRALDRIADVKTKKVGMSAMHVDFVHELKETGATLKADRATERLMKSVAEADNAIIKTPKGIQADLRDYQKDGYRWMARLSMWGAGACLADDMGLGKTLQTICLLHSRRKGGPSLVVAPTSLLLNWRDEIARFAPALNVTLLNSTNDTARRREMVVNAGACDVVVTSYGLLVNEQEALAAKEWNVMALDEAHTIKNRDTKMSQAAMTLHGAMRVALTGTPLQNRLSEIWNIFQFINPGLLGSYQSFCDRFIIPIEKDSDRHRQKLLKRILSPFLLRRTKSDVLNELPPKTEIEVKVELSAEERSLYETLRRQAELAVAEGGSQSAILALAEITRLRQAACNARLVEPGLKIESSKTTAFMQLVDNLHSNHHRALVFSQFTSHLELIRERLDAAGVEYLYLDGSTPVAERGRLVAQFQESDIPLFLISLKAGGLGLNLTAADYVIHLDPWWNPAIEDQASDRSHRIGQTKPVTVYRIIAADTIEEKILRLHAHKKSLADALLEGSDMSARMTREEILALLSEA